MHFSFKPDAAFVLSMAAFMLFAGLLNSIYAEQVTDRQKKHMPAVCWRSLERIITPKTMRLGGYFEVALGVVLAAAAAMIQLR